EKPHVRTRTGEFDVAQTLAPHLGKRDFNAAFVADHAAMFHALVFAAQALPIRNRSENTRTEQTVLFGFERSIVDGLRLSNFTVRPGANLFWGGQTDSNAVKIGNGCRSVVRIRSNHANLPLSCWFSFH